MRTPRAINSLIDDLFEKKNIERLVMNFFFFFFFEKWYLRIFLGSKMGTAL